MKGELWELPYFLSDAVVLFGQFTLWEQKCNEMVVHQRRLHLGCTGVYIRLYNFTKEMTDGAESKQC